MRCVTFASAVLLGMSALLALAQAPSGPDSATGDWPGYEGGTGNAPSASTIGNNATTHDYPRTGDTSRVAGHAGQRPDGFRYP
jgi:hypothetical protein